MRGLGGLVWTVMVLALLVGIAALVGSRFIGEPDAMRGFVREAKKLDAIASSRLDDLGLRFAPRPTNNEPKVDLEQPTDTDFAFLFEILESGDQKARISAARVLKDIGDVRAVRPLFKAVRGMEDVDRFFLECALTILERDDVSPQRRLAVLVPVWEEESTHLTDEMRAAVRLKLRDAGALDPDYLYEVAVSSGDPAVRRFAIREIGEMPRPPGGVLAAAMSDPDLSVRELAEETFLAAAAKRGRTN